MLKGKAEKEPKTSIEKIPELVKQPSFQNTTLAPITTWIGKPKSINKLGNFKIMKSQISTSHEKYPDGLVAIPSSKEGGAPRIIFPVDVQRDLVLQAHLDIHHQNHSKVYKLLSPLCYWSPINDQRY